MRFFRLATTAALAGFVVTGCSFTDGEPWGYVDGRAAAEPLQDGTTSPLPDALRLRKARLEATIRLESVESTSGNAGGSFDPSNPPDGYSLCHNGHCHSDEGDLVPYDEIEAEAEAGGVSTSTLGSWSGTIDLLSGEPARFPKIAITDRTTVDRLHVEATNLVLEGTWESGGNDESFEAQLGTFDLGETTSVGIDIGPDSPETQTARLCLTWQNQWFKQVDFDALERQDSNIRLTRILNPDATTKVVGAVQQAALKPSNCQ